MAAARWGAATRRDAGAANDAAASDGTPASPPEEQGPRHPQQGWCACGPAGAPGSAPFDGAPRAGSGAATCPAIAPCIAIPGIDDIPAAHRPAANGAMPVSPATKAAWQSPTTVLSTVSED